MHEAERRRIARVVHGDLGGLLTALRLNLQRLSYPELLTSIAADSLGLVDEALACARAITGDLRSAVLDDLGLGAAVAWYAHRQAERAGYVVTIENTLGATRLPEEIETVTFRILQQAFTNIARHAAAGDVRVELSWTAPRFELSVSDDGVGFDVEVARARTLAGESFGLLDMSELAALAGGHLSIDSSPGRGSTISASFVTASR
jgi:two-component system sensor histidine kinase UhpB